MRWILGASGLALLVGVASPPPADALCVCDVFDNCTSAPQCDGKSPGDTCSPPRNATCKIVQGNGNGLSCCCGCSRGPGPISCLYTPVADQLAVLGESVCAAAATGPTPLGQSCVCADRKLDKQVDTVVKQAGKSLRKADQACNKGKSATKQARTARKKINGLKKKIQRAESRGDITGDCATLLNGLVDEFIIDVDEAGQGGPSTTTTTTTTLPSGPTCAPTFHTVVGFPSEFDFRFICQGGKDTLTGFTIQVASGFTVTNHIEPAGFPRCEQNGVLACTSNFGFLQEITGRIQTNPAPTSPGFSADLWVATQGGDTLGPFPFTGP